MTAGKARAALAASAAILVLAGLIAAPSMTGLAEAKKQKVDPMEDTDAGRYEEHFPDLADLDIKSYGFDHKNAYIEVYGTAGGTHAEHDVSAEGDTGFGYAIAYVLTIVTRSGEVQTWAIDSHEAQHGTGGPGSEWHAHKVVLGDNPRTADTEGSDCLNEVDHVTHAMTDGNRMVFEDMKVKTKKGVVGIEAKSILSANTVLLQLQVPDPDDASPDTPCIAKVRQGFDSATLGKVNKD